MCILWINNKFTHKTKYLPRMEVLFYICWDMSASGAGNSLCQKKLSQKMVNFWSKSCLRDGVCILWPNHFFYGFSNCEESLFLWFSHKQDVNWIQSTRCQNQWSFRQMRPTECTIKKSENVWTFTKPPSGLVFSQLDKNMFHHVCW